MIVFSCPSRAYVYFGYLDTYPKDDVIL